MNVIIVNAFGRSNRGDSVLLDECISEIREVHPDAVIGISLFDNNNTDPIDENIIRLERIGNSGVTNKYLSSIHKLYLILISVLYSVTKFELILRAVPQKQKNTLLFMRSADLSISSPGGYIHDTNFAYLIALINIIIPINLGVKSILAPQSIGPLRSSLSRLITRSVLNRCSTVCARERYTLEFLDKLKINKSIVQSCGDTAFWNNHLDFSNTDRFRNELDIGEKDFIGLTVVNWTFPNTRYPETKRSEYINAISDVIKYLHDETGMKIVIFNQVTDDLTMAYAIKAKLQNPRYLVIDDTEKEPWELRALISKCKLFIGTRFHSCIFAIMAGVPTIAISYLPKTQYILEDLGLFDRSTPINSINSDFLKRKAMYCYQNAEQESALMREAVESYKIKFKRLADIL